MTISRSIPDILADLVRQSSLLARTEVQLARAELSEKVSQTSAALVLLVCGAALIIPGLVVLFQAAVAALQENAGIPAPWAALIVGGSVVVIGLVLLFIGRSRLKVDRLLPTRTVEQLQRDAAVVKPARTSDESIERAA